MIVDKRTDHISLNLADHAVDAGRACVHCGLCLPACPTYTETLDEADSPRGRITLMLGLHHGDVGYDASVKGHLDGCLNCRACETACPSGVVYHQLLEETRHRLRETRVDKSVGGRGWLRWFFLRVLTQPRRLKLALLPARLMQKAKLYGPVRGLKLPRLLPRALRKMEAMLGPGEVWPKPLPERSRSGGVHNLIGALAPGSIGKPPTKPKVGFVPGCVGSVMFNDVNRKAIELLAAAGADVLVPKAQTCCGAIHHHAAETEAARAMARTNIDAFEADRPEMIATTIAGCGAMLRDYADLLADDPKYAERAKQFVSTVRDVSEVLVQLGMPALEHPVRRTVTYHDACHLCHAQKVTAEPRALLEAVPGLTLLPLAESDICCGAAGTYNLTQPAMAERLAHRKLDRIADTNADTVAMGNVGCATHLRATAAERGDDIDIVHPVDILHEALFGRDGDG
ncbi:MAG: heterodisulfide reductase-related iron-sulfur binding cluster [Planctomycetota bacterium]